MIDQSFRSRTFTVTDPDARLRKPDALDEFLLVGGVPGVIPRNTEIRVDQVSVVPAGAKKVALFVHALPASGGAALGWTSAGNLDGKLVSETIGSIAPPAGANRFGPNAAWSNGAYLGQITLVKVVGSGNEIEHIAAATCDAFLAMVAAARADGVPIELNSGFRSWPEQQYLYDGRQRGLPGFNPANPPGMSNHQNGIAFDLSVGGGGTNPTYVWLTRHATSHGFLRTVSREAWHWEYLPEKAARAKARGVFTSWD